MIKGSVLTAFYDSEEEEVPEAGNSGIFSTRGL